MIKGKGGTRHIPILLRSRVGTSRAIFSLRAVKGSLNQSEIVIAHFLQSLA
ncbi:unknown protein [Microcystis aeruginosa NIES-843]|uniref:Uncharacterized protein n=1 Tax=Microcystis aeruginosa (strain NIES-843 / IAM M-2473) TaxID=449447 RepID=B0JQM0_MICAN|nr:unknown protein [Microcystis aeruginosa NIES-843]